MNFQIFIALLHLVLSSGSSIRRNRILNGENANIDEYPYLASLRYITSNFHFCGGTIINSKHILTAAHCAYDKEVDEIRVFTGSSTIQSTSGHAHVVVRIEVHPLFEKSPKSNHDIAIVVVKKNIPFNRYQNKIDLPTSGIHDNENAIIIGWGKTSDSSLRSSEVLQKGQVKIMNLYECRKFTKIHLYDEQICAKSVKQGVHSSLGDSGGPLVANRKIIGISSGSFPNIKSYPDLYTNVFAYLDFIGYITSKDWLI